jgi:hypothetical protein
VSNESAKRPATSRASLLKRLRERGVLRVAASYAVIAWLILQIASVVFEPLAVPKWALTTLIIAAAVGFPIAIALAWFLEVGEHGVELDTAPEGVPRPTARGLRHYADAIVIGVLLVAMLVFRDRAALRRMLDPVGLVAFAVVAFTWFGILVAQVPSRLRYFVGYEVYDRVFTSTHNRNAEWYGALVVYGPMFLFGALPWRPLAMIAAGGHGVRGLIFARDSRRATATGCSSRGGCCCRSRFSASHSRGCSST